MSVLTKTLMTAEEFFLLPNPDNGSQIELVRGEVIAMSPPGGIHGAACSKVDRKLGNFVDLHDLGTITVNDTGFVLHRDPDTVRGPDIAYWKRERLPEIPVGYIPIPPDLAVEVLSPSNTSKKIREKLGEYFEVGVPLVWVVSPEDRTVTIYRQPEEGRVLHENAMVTGEDILPGFECKVREFLP